jgi:hypothetical protein
MFSIPVTHVNINMEGNYHIYANTKKKNPPTDKEKSEE